MQPTLCSKCKKNVAVVFISRMNEKNEMVNEGLCLKCAAQLGLPQVEDMMKRMGITPEDLENINSEMMQAFGGAEELDTVNDEGDEDRYVPVSEPPVQQRQQSAGRAAAVPERRRRTARDRPQDGEEAQIPR